MSDPQSLHPDLPEQAPPDETGEIGPTSPGPAAEPAPGASVQPLDAAASEAQRKRRRRRRRGMRSTAAEEHCEGGTGSAGEALAAPSVPEAPAVQEPETTGPEGFREGSSDRPSAASIRDDGAPADIDPVRLDWDGLKILNRLHRYSHQAYFVGGCVRDLLLGRQPKDFDIATSAHPGEVRSLFRNCRLIGRRFRLAHVFFRGGKIIEVSTFRANPVEVEAGEDPPEDLLITRDNVFGTAEQDARRRDFTVNGLFYDIRLARVIDYVDGLTDLHTRTIRTIGNPEIRMREDPVRILRAVRFASRLDFDIHPQTYAAMEGAVEDLPRCAPARVLEEVLRLLRTGHSRRAFDLLHALGALRLLLPPIGEHLERTGDAGRADLLARLGALDVRIASTGVDDSTIIAVLLTPLTRSPPETGDGDLSPGEVVDTLLDQMVQSARLSRRLADRARVLLWAQGILSGERTRKRSLASFRRHPIFSDALGLLEIGVEATGVGRELVERWRNDRGLDAPPTAPGEGRKRRRRRRRRGGGGPKEGAPPVPSDPAT